MKKIAVFIQNQYRMDDHPALSAAIESTQAEDGTRVTDSVIAFTLRDEQEQWNPDSPLPLCGPFRKRFQDQAIQALESELGSLGIPLLQIKCTNSADSTNESPSLTTESILNHLKAWDVDTVFCSQQHLYEQKWLMNADALSIRLKVFPGNHLYSDWPIKSEKIPKVFTDFKKGLDRQPDPSATDLRLPNSHSPLLLKELNDPRSGIPFDGSEHSAQQRLTHYFFESAGLSQYKKTRNGLIGTEYSSKLSPFLAVGSLSVRRIWSAIDQHDARFGKNDGSEWMRYELLWREFFHWQSRKYPEQFFSVTGIQNKKQDCTPDLEQLQKWINGKTGDAFVDACMTELRTTGYLSNRGRQNAASYLVHTLRLPWLWGARYFEWILIDYDRTQNYGNWAYLAGVGADPRSFGNQGPRFFNTEKQANDYDPDGSYRNLWKSTD
jgi:deoxyribodipyrimidine photo-lyase